MPGQEDPKHIQALRMNVKVLMVTALLLVLLCSAPAPSEALGSWAGTLRKHPGVGGPGEDPWPPGDEGVNLPGQGLDRSHSVASAWEVMGARPPSKAMARPPLGTGEQDPRSKPRRHPPQPSRSRRLSHHLKGHGKFNGDTYSCHSIQFRPCQKPSDCGGCLGLYTCKLPSGTCGLKGVSRQRGGFLQSIQSPEGRRVLLIPPQHSST